MSEWIATCCGVSCPPPVTEAEWQTLSDIETLGHVLFVSHSPIKIFPLDIGHTIYSRLGKSSKVQKSHNAKP